jgi:hypothetical protein
MGPTGPRVPRATATSTSIGGPYTFRPGLHSHQRLAREIEQLHRSDVRRSLSSNTLGVASVSNGSFVATGSPNKPFKYLVLTP